MAYKAKHVRFLNHIRLADSLLRSTPSEADLHRAVDIATKWLDQWDQAENRTPVKAALARHFHTPQERVIQVATILISTTDKLIESMGFNQAIDSAIELIRVMNPQFPDIDRAAAAAELECQFLQEAPPCTGTCAGR